jgi:hypothetical protein
MNAMQWLLWCAPVLSLAAPDGTIPPPDLIVNGGLEHEWEGWDALWTREPGAGTATLDRAARGDGPAARIEHRGAQDWSLAQGRSLAVAPGEIFELSAWLRVEGAGDATLGVITRDSAGKALDWAHGGRTVRATKDGQVVRTRFVIPPDTTTILPRLIGHGPATVWLDNVSLVRQGSLDSLRAANLPAEVAIENDLLRVAVRTADATFSVLDRRSGRTWTQQPGGAVLIVTSAQTVAGAGIDLRLLDPSSTQSLAARLRLERDRPEVVVTLRAVGPMEAPPRLARSLCVRTGSAADPAAQRRHQLSGE